MGRAKGATKERVKERFSRFIEIIRENCNITREELSERGYPSSYTSRNRRRANIFIEEEENKRSEQTKQEAKNLPDIKESQLSKPNSEPNKNIGGEDMPISSEDITKITEGLKVAIEPLKVDLSGQIDKIKNINKEGRMGNEEPKNPALDISKIIDEVKKEVGKAVFSTVTQEFDRRELERRRKEEEAKKAKEQQELREKVEETSQKAMSKEEFEAFCSLNPNDKKCQGFISRMTEIVKEAVKPVKSEEKPAEKKKEKPIPEVKKEEPKKAKTPTEIVLEKLIPINKEVRDKMAKEEQEIRDVRVREILDKYNVSLVDAWRQIEKDKVSMENLPQKKEIRQAVLTSMNDEELAEAAKTCVGEECSLIKMEKDERGRQKYLIRDGKEWKPFGEKEGPHI